MSEVMKSLKGAGGPAMSAPQTESGMVCGGMYTGSKKAPIPAGKKLGSAPQGATADSRACMKS